MSKSSSFRRLRGPWLVAFLAGAAGTGWYLTRSEGTAVQYETVAVTRGDMTQVVTASGQLNPVTKVEVGSQISGIIQKLFADFNSTVKAGQVIAQLDPSSYEATLIQAQGNLASARAAEELARLNAQRAQVLQDEKLNAKADYEKALADLHQAEAGVKISEGALKKAEVDLARCTIYSPIDGIVISRNVDVGQTVAASLSAPILFLIANDLSKMQIEADVAEADIGMVAVDQNVEFTVDAFPGRTFNGKVTQVRNSPKVELGVVTYVTVIQVQNPDLKLKPGMTANVSIIVARSPNALKIPGVALRFRPPKSSEVKKTDGARAAADSKNDRKGEGGPRARSKEKRRSERTVYLALARSGNADGAEDTRPVQIKTGISDGVQVEVLEGLKEGDRVITGAARNAPTQEHSVNPFSFGRRR